MDALNCIKTRRSVRRFQDSPVEWEKVVNIIDAGKECPTAGNLQNFRFIVMTDEGKRNSLAEASMEQDWMQSAPVHIVICSLPYKAAAFYGIRGEKLYSIQNCAAAAENMLLAAHAQGLGACWVGAFDEDKVIDICGIDANGRPQAIIVVGHPDETPPRPAKSKLNDVFFINGWWGRVADKASTMGRMSHGNKNRVEGAKQFMGKVKEKVSNSLKSPPKSQ